MPAGVLISSPLASSSAESPRSASGSLQEAFYAIVQGNDRRDDLELPPHLS